MDKKKMEQLRVQLEAVHTWPEMFMFKFIFLNEKSKILEVKALFDESAEITEKLSRNGKYMSLTVKEMIMKSDDVFERYLAASKIDGVMSL